MCLCCVITTQRLGLELLQLRAAVIYMFIDTWNTLKTPVCCDHGHGGNQIGTHDLSAKRLFNSTRVL